MHSYRGRGGPRQSTPANVQCQKCLKRGHYSYECKAGLQERPYKARPSRTQQLLNPKLAPKLTNDAPEEIIKKKGVADQELAKKEAERARKRDVDSDEEPSPKGYGRKPRRHNSVDSVSSISTRPSLSPPPRRRASPSPRREQDVSPPQRHFSRSRSRSYDSVSDDSRRRSPSPERGVDSQDPRRRSPPRRSPSPDDGYQSRDDRRHRSPSFEQLPPRRARGLQAQRHRSRSRSPRRLDSRGEGRYRDREDYEGRGGPSRGQAHQRSPPRQREPPRERSLSPFSKRLALTQAMNMGR